MVYECIEQFGMFQLPDNAVDSHHLETAQTRLDEQAGSIVEKHKRPFTPGLRAVQCNRPVVRAGTLKLSQIIAELPCHRQ